MKILIQPIAGGGWDELELSASQMLSFNKKNPLFGLDDMECERTQSFDIPDTAHNEMVLELAKIPAFVGSGMRKKFNAQLQDGAVVKGGYLYVTEYDGSKYKGTFVTGELFGLKAITDAGSAKDLLVNWSDSLLWDASQVKSADATSIPTFGLVKYKRVQDEPSVVTPSFNLQGLIQNCAAKVPFKTKNMAGAERARIVLEKPQGIDQSVTIWATRTGDGSEASTSNIGVLRLGSIQYNVFNFYIQSENLAWSVKNLDSWTTLAGWYSEHNVTITFPNDFPDYMVMVTQVVTETGGTGTGNWEPATFLGEYIIEQDGTGATTGRLSGNPLAGRKIEITAGTYFGFVDARDYRVKSVEGQTYLAELVGAVKFQEEAGEWAEGKGYDVTGQPDYGPFVLNVEQTDEVEPGGTEQKSKLIASANVPDIDVIDLLKTYAAITGRTLNYSDADGVIFDEWSGWSDAVVLDKVVKVDKVERAFADYGRANTIRFDSDDMVLASEKIKRMYVVDNDFIDADNELYEIPVSEASEYDAGDGDVYALVRNGASDDGYIESMMLMQTNEPGGGEFMRRVKIPEDAGLTAACKKGTTVEVTTVMSLTEFEAVKSKTPLLLDGVLYCWQEGTWSKGQAKWTMVAIE